MKPGELDIERLWQEMEAQLARCVHAAEVYGHLKARQMLEQLELHAESPDVGKRSIAELARLGLLMGLLDAAQKGTLTAEGTGS